MKGASRVSARPLPPCPALGGALVRPRRGGAGRGAASSRGKRAAVLAQRCARTRPPVRIPRLRRSWTMSWERPGHSPALSTPMFPVGPGLLLLWASVGPQPDALRRPFLEKCGQRREGHSRRGLSSARPPTPVAPLRTPLCRFAASGFQASGHLSCGATCWPRAAVGTETTWARPAPTATTAPLSGQNPHTPDSNEEPPSDAQFKIFVSTLSCSLSFPDTGFRSRRPTRKFTRPERTMKWN